MRNCYGNQIISLIDGEKYELEIKIESEKNCFKDLGYKMLEVYSYSASYDINNQNEI